MRTTSPRCLPGGSKRGRPVRGGLAALCLTAAVAGRVLGAEVQAPPAPTASPSPSPEASPAAPAPASPSMSPPEVRVVPYGLVFVNGFSNSGGTNNVDIPLFATPGAANVGSTARGTRLGIRMTGATVGSAKLSGLVEADFFGGFPAIGIGDSMGGVRLRVALARVDWTRTTLVAGQDWMVFAPLNPVSIACHGIPLMAASGNAWARLPQLRLERRAGALTAQAAVLAPSTGDFSSAFFAQPASGGMSRLPFFQARLTVSSKQWAGSGKPASIGISGHYGRSRTIVASTNFDRDSAAGALDWSVPLGHRVTVSGEAFAGENLAGFQAAVFQGLNPDPVPAAGPRPITTRGGWAQLGVAATDELTFYGTYGLDDPDDQDLVSSSKHDWRTKNESVALSFVHKASERFSWSVEARQARTTLLQSGRHGNVHVNVGASLAF